MVELLVEILQVEIMVGPPEGIKTTMIQTATENAPNYRVVAMNLFMIALIQTAIVVTITVETIPEEILLEETLEAAHQIRDVLDVILSIKIEWL